MTVQILSENRVTSSIMREVEKVITMIICRLPTILILAGMLSTIAAKAQDSTKVEKKYFSIIPVPVVGASPTTGFLFGGAVSGYWMTGNVPQTSLSNATAAVLYTANAQLMATIKSTTFFVGDKLYMITDLRYLNTSAPTYGLGTGPQSAKPVGTGFADYTDDLFARIEEAQMMEFNHVRVHNSIMARIQNKRLFIGAGYHLDYHYSIKDNLLNLQAAVPVVTSHYAYSVSNGFNPLRYSTSGLSANVIFDSRDNTVNPYSGRYAFVSFRVNPVFMGSSQASSTLWLEYRDYFRLSNSRPRHLIGLWSYGWFVTSGNVPYLDLPALGWDQFGRSGRAYTQGRFRGQQLVYNEIEYRVPLQRQKETLGAVVFINGTTATNSAGNISLFDYYDIGYGAGLRVMINKKSRANLNIDYAVGQYGAHGFYFGVNEVF